MRTILLDINLGLGDAIICNGLVRELAKAYEVHLPCWPRNFPSVVQMFCDLDNVHVFEQSRFGLIADHCDEVRHIGVERNSKWGSIRQWDRAFYDFAGVSFSARWDSFYIPPSDNPIAVPDFPYALFHEDVPRGFRIDPARVSSEGLSKIYVSPSAAERKPGHVIADWIPLISNATEVHCIDSCVMHLVESVPTTGALFYHQYARPAVERMHVNAVTRKPWEVLA